MKSLANRVAALQAALDAANPVEITIGVVLEVVGDREQCQPQRPPRPPPVIPKGARVRLVVVDEDTNEDCHRRT
jgi:hypothetical protein